MKDFLWQRLLASNYRGDESTMLSKSDIAEIIDNSRYEGKMNGRLRFEIEQLEQRIRKLEEAQRWIPVSERLPEVDTRVEIFDGFEQTMHIGYYREHAKQWDSEDGGYWHGKNFGLITHWRPLPEPPEVE